MTDVKQGSKHYILDEPLHRAGGTRPEITRELWEQINHLFYMLEDGIAKKKWQKKDPRDFFTEIKKGCQLIYGITDSTISRTEGWHFGKIG